MSLFRSGAADWRERRVAVIGLARSGRSAAVLLGRAGARVYASDSGSSDALEQTALRLRATGVAVELGGHDLARIGESSLVVVSPGVPPDAPPLVAARSAGVPVVSEVEIGLSFLPGLRYVAITGTNGKTTTTSLTAQLLLAVGRRAVAAGNIGLPLAEVALEAEPPEWAALEISSFQLHDTPGIAPDVGVITNLSANHLDRYTSIDEYYGDKALLFRNATPRSRWVTNADDRAVEQMSGPVAGEHRRFSLLDGDERRAGPVTDAWLDRSSGALVVLGVPLIQRDELQLVGDHNVANALAAALAVMIADQSHRSPRALAAIADALRGFRALVNRIETVAEVDGITWINDSKSTNVASTRVALQGMTRPTVLLLGGRHKGDPYASLADELRRTVRGVIAFGEAGPLIEDDLAGVVPTTRLGSSFERVIEEARRMARPGDVVLLSPACSSYDMFTDYEDRGRQFKRLVGAADAS